MMCHRFVFPPISTIGLGRTVVSSAKRVPKPPARITVFISSLSTRFKPILRNISRHSKPMDSYGLHHFENRAVLWALILLKRPRLRSGGMLGRAGMFTDYE